MLKRADLHVHTRFSEWKHLKIIKPRDSYNEPIEVYRRCKALGMDFVVITDHDTIDGALDLLSDHPDLEPEIIVGEEVETWFPDTRQWVHVNVFDIDESIHDDIEHLRPDVRDLVAYLKQRRIFHVLNHPFQSYRLQKRARLYVEEILELFDHFETGNGTLSTRHNAAVLEMLEYAAALYLTKYGVGGSDAHNLRNIGLFHTEANLPDDTLPGRDMKREWLAALARGEGRAAGRAISALALTANVYRIIGNYYLSLRDPQVRRRMGPISYAAAAVLAPVCLTGLPAFLNLGNSLRLEAVSLYLRRSLRRLRQADPAGLAPAELIEDSPD